MLCVDYVKYYKIIDVVTICVHKNIYKVTCNEGQRKG